MADRVLYPNIPAPCLFNRFIIQHPNWAQYGVLDLDFNRTTLHPVGPKIKGVNTSLSHLQGFWWTGFNGNENNTTFDALSRSRDELRANDRLWLNKKIINQYFELLISKLLCNECKLRSPSACQPLCLFQTDNPDLLIVPLVRNFRIPRIELPIIHR